MNSINKIKITALIVARNEEKHIKECIESLNTIDEIILLLDRTTDNTINIAKNFNCTIFEGSWESEGNRRNEGIEKCSNNWILEIDADERANKELIKEAKNKINLLKDKIPGASLAIINAPTLDSEHMGISRLFCAPDDASDEPSRFSALVQLVLESVGRAFRFSCARDVLDSRLVGCERVDQTTSLWFAWPGIPDTLGGAVAETSNPESK